MDAGLDTGSEFTDFEEEEPTTFIRWLIERPGTNWLCEIDTVFIEDRFNLYGLDEIFPRFKQCIEVILGGAPATAGAHGDLVSEAVDLYGMIHARFILTPRGLPAMLEKFSGGLFGSCPRFHCRRQFVLPVGLSEKLHERQVMRYCPCCGDVYELCPTEKALMKEAVDQARALAPPPSSGASSDGSSAGGGVGPPSPFLWGCHFTGLDGAFFGPTFPHLLGLHAPELVFRFLRHPAPPPPGGQAPADRSDPVAVDAHSYVPRIHGFRVHNQRGPVSRGAGDSLGVYATAVAAAPAFGGGGHTVVGAGGRARRSAGGEAAASGAASPSPAVGEGPGTGPGPLAPVASAELADYSVRAGAPPIPAPFVWPVPGIPGGVPVYGEAAASVSAATGTPAPRADWPAGGRFVEHAGVSYLIMRPSGVPLTSVYPRGQKPLDDDFTDGEGDEAAPGGAPDAAAAAANRKRRRKT